MMILGFGLRYEDHLSHMSCVGQNEYAGLQVIAEVEFRAGQVRLGLCSGCPGINVNIKY